MSAIRPEFHTSLAQNLIDDIYYNRASFYHFLGKIDPWEDDSLPPPRPNASQQQEQIIRDNILYLWRAGNTDASLVVRGPQWESNTIFEQWDHTKDMIGRNFYCINRQFNVYKCLDNNHGAPSTAEPEGQLITPFTTSDGYLWKYLYNVPTFKRVRFLSRGMIPVQKALSESFYNRGMVDTVEVIDGGSGYNDVQLTSIVVSTNNVTGSGASAYISAVGALGQITQITVTTPGSGYLHGAMWYIDTEIGSGAQLRVNTSNGEVVSVDIERTGYGYQVGEAVQIAVGGAELIPVVSKETGEIVDVKIINPGAGYSSPPTLIIDQSPASGTGKYGNATAILTAVVYQGSIVRVLIEDPGKNYPVDTATTIIVQGDGEGAQFAPVVYQGSIISVVVIDPGINYSYCDIVVVGAGSGAVLKSVLSSSNFLTDQSTIEQTSVPGAIYNAVVTNQGTGYGPRTEVVVEGDGEGASAIPVIEGGAIIAVKMTAWGSGYTYANIKFVDPGRIEPHTFIDAEAYAILPPPNGHGVDAPKELYADTVAIFAQLRDEYELHLLEQDYRQYGLIRNPKSLMTNERQMKPRFVTSFNVGLSHINNLAPDDIIVNQNTRYRVIDIEGTYVELQQLTSKFGYPEGIFYKEDNPAIQYGITRINKVPTLNKYSGDLLYITNSTPFTPSGEQTIAIRTYVKL